MVRSSDLKREIKTVIDSDVLPKTAVLTCDIESDFGGRAGSYELLEDRKYAEELLQFCSKHQTPLSGFVVTSLLDKKYSGIEVFEESKIDLHAHSSSHDVKVYSQDSKQEIRQSQEEFTAHFGRPSLGYRAPQGVIYPGDVRVMDRAGYQFDSSIFPSRRRGVFDYRDLPRDPWIWKGGVVELPFLSTPDMERLTLSTLKLRGKKYWERKLTCHPEGSAVALRDAPHSVRGPQGDKPIVSKDDNCNLPNIVIIDTHLHDFFTPSSFRRLPILYKFAYSRNRDKGFEYLTWLIELLRSQGYEFQTATELFQQVLD